jgi:hypothetical protein
VVDNSVTGTYTTPTLTSDIHHEALWTSPTMHKGSHTIVITQTAAQSAGVIFLDYIMYNTISSTVHPYFIDDRDLRIKYSTTWKKFGSESNFQHSSEGSTFAGDSFSLQFEGKCQLLPVRLFSLMASQASPSCIKGELIIGDFTLGYIFTFVNINIHGNDYFYKIKIFHKHDLIVLVE